jgi:hypothetical protein
LYGEGHGPSDLATIENDRSCRSSVTLGNKVLFYPEIVCHAVAKREIHTWRSRDSEGVGRLVKNYFIDETV